MANQLLEYEEKEYAVTNSAVVDVVFNGSIATIKTKLSNEVNNYIVENLRYTDKSALYAYKKMGIRSNPYVCLYDWRRQQFSTGLLYRVLQLIHSMGARANILKQVSQNKVVPVRLPDWFHSHQAEAVEVMLKYKRCLVEAPTGSGKTIAAIYFLLHFPESNILFTVPSKDLLHQTAEVLESFLDEPIGKYGDKCKDIQRVTVGIVNSLASTATKDPSIFKDFNVVIHDEAHGTPAGYYEKLSKALTNIEYAIGITATAVRATGDELRMEATCGPVGIRIPNDALIEKGVILSPTVYYLKCHEYPVAYTGAINHMGRTIYETENGKPDLHHVVQEGLVYNECRNKLLINALHYAYIDPNRKGPILVFVEAIEHGLILTDMAKQAGITMPFISGKGKGRKELIKDLKENKVQAVCCTRIFNEGIDITNLEYGIIACGGPNEKRIIQQIGRIIRAHKGKNRAIIIDIDDTESYYLRRHTTERRAAVTKRYGNCYEILNSPETLRQKLLYGR